MAEDVKGADVVPIKRGRGRPKGSGKKTPALTVHNGGGGSGTSTDTSRAALETAPGLGHNGADESLFLSWVRQIRGGQAQVAEAQQLVKTAKGKLKDIRTQAKGEGIVLRELDMALEELDLERVDLAARYERERLYRTFLGLPADGKQASVVSEDEAGAWFHRGDIAGRLGEDRTVPEGCPGERVQDWLKGWEKGQEALMRTSPLTAAGFKKPGEHAGPPATNPEGAAAPAERPTGGILVLKPEHFATDTDLEDASRATLLRDHLEAWNNAERVVALFNAKRRILKEPGFEDTGEADSETSDAEELPSEDNPLAGIVDGDAAVEAGVEVPVETPVVVGDPDGQVEETPPPADPVDDDADETEGELEAQLEAQPWNDGREVVDGQAPAGVVYYLAEAGPYESGKRPTYKDGAPFSSSSPTGKAGKATPIYREHAPKVAGSLEADSAARINADREEGGLPPLAAGDDAAPSAAGDGAVDPSELA